MYAQMQGCESMHARMGNLSQCMPKCGEGFCKILLAVWATWFIILQKLAFCKICYSVCLVFFFFFLVFFFVCNHWCSDSFLTKQALHPHNISCIVVPQWQPTYWWHHFKVKVKGQGHIAVKEGCQRNPYFLSSFYQINSKLGVRVAYELPLSWLIFGADRPWTSWVSLRMEICLPKSIEGTMRYHIV